MYVVIVNNEIYVKRLLISKTFQVIQYFFIVKIKLQKQKHKSLPLTVVFYNKIMIWDLWHELHLHIVCHLTTFCKIYAAYLIDNWTWTIKGEGFRSSAVGTCKKQFLSSGENLKNIKLCLIFLESGRQNCKSPN